MIVQNKSSSTSPQEKKADYETIPLMVKNLSVVYDHEPVLSGVSFALTPGSMTAIVGPNGAGKSTLLRSCLGLVPTSGGEALFFGKPFRKARRQIAFMPQREAVDWNFQSASSMWF